MQEEQPLTDEENHQIWMSNAGYLYDRLLIQKLKWPSLTFQWLPFQELSPTHAKYRFIYASHSSQNAPSQHLYIAEVTFPTLKSIQEETGEAQSSTVKNIYKFNYQLQINKARHCPNKPTLIAARTDEGPVTIFEEGTQYPITLLDGVLNGGFALDWKEQGIVSGDFNGQLMAWRSLEDKSISLNYSINIEDTKWVTQDVISCVADDGFLLFWDLRVNKIVQQVQTAHTDKKELYAVAPNPVQHNLILTAGQDQAVKIWDSRNLKVNLHRFEDHSDNVVTLDWSKSNSSIFASGSADKKVKIWDLMRVGFEIPKDLGGTDQLLFTHEGHKGGVNDICWNPYELLLGSSEEDNNTIQFYQITNNIHELEYAEDVEYLRQQCFS